MAEAKLPAHPARRMGILFLSMGGLGVLSSIEFCGDMLGAAISGGMSAFMIWAGWRIVGEGPVVQRGNLALDQLNRGHLAEAESMLDSIPPRRLAHQVRRSIEIQRAMLALRRRDPTGAVTHATRAIEGRMSLLSYPQERNQVVAARAIRAVARASADDVAGALSDVAAVRGSKLATPATLAQVSLAQAITLSRAKQQGQLAALLKHDRKLLLEFTTPRDRTLVRALQRTLYESTGSAYRDASRPEPPPESDLADWVSHVAPATAGQRLAGGAVAASTTSEMPEAAETPGAKGALASVQKRGRPFHGRVALLMWTVLIVIFLGIYQWLTPSVRAVAPVAVPASSRAAEASASPLLPLVILAIGFSGFVVYSRRGAHRLSAALRLLTLEDLAPAERELTTLAKSRAPMTAARAGTALATLATRRARFAEALAITERAIARVARVAVATDVLLPGLLAQRAWLLAALDRADDARQELATLAAAHPTYPWLIGAQLTTHTLLAVRRGDLAAASAFAARRTPDMPLSLQNEVLADVLAANAEERPDRAEVERLREEPRSDAELRHWLHAIWPASESALEGASARAA